MPSVGLELVVVAGLSDTERVEFSAQTEATRALLGSARECDWRLSGGGVEPQHAEIAWDGEQLWVRDPGSKRGVFVGRERVGDWRTLAPGERITLGDAALQVRSMGAGPSLSAAAKREQGRFDEDDEGGTLVSSDKNAPELKQLRDKARAAMVAPSTGAGAGAKGAASKLPMPAPSGGGSKLPMPGALSGSKGTPAAGVSKGAPPVPSAKTTQRRFDEDDEGGTLVSNESASPEIAKVRADRAAANAKPPARSVAPQPQPPAHSQRPPAREPSAVSNVKGSAPESTMIVQNPYANIGEDTAERLAPPPGPRPSVPSQNALPLPRVTAKLAAAPPPRVTGISASVPSTPQEPVYPQAVPSYQQQPQQPAPGMNEYGVPALEPAGPTDTAGFTSLFGDVPPPPPPEEKSAAQKLPLPPRTLALLGVTLAAGLGFLFLSNPPEPPPRPQGPARVSAPPPPRPTVIYTPPLPGPPSGPMGATLLAATTYTPPPPPDPRVRLPPPPRVPPPPPPPTPERIAADMLSAGRIRESIPLYTFVAQAHPDAPVYGQLTHLLRRKLESQQNPCPPGSTAPCPTATPGGTR